MQNTVQVDIKWVGSHQSLPKYATPESAAVDLHADIPSSKIIYPGESILIPTGLAMRIKNPNVMATLLPRSGLGSKHGIVLGNLVGVVDADYIDQVYVSVWNRHEENSYTITPMERIAQCVFVPILRAEFNVVEELEKTQRHGGFGHSGRL